MLTALQNPGRNSPHKVNYSCRFDATDSSYLTRTNSGTSVSGYKFTFSAWVKRGSIGSAQIIAGGKNDGDNKCYFGFNASNNFEIHHKRNEAWQCDLVTSATYTSTTTWYHIHYVYNSTEAAAADRATLTINGTKITSWGTADYPGSSEAARFIENGQNTQIGRYADGANYFDGKMAEVYVLAGVAVSASNFAQTYKGLWVPKSYTVGDNSEGTMSFKLDFANSSALGTDVSTNGSDFTVSGMGTDHRETDTPTS